MGGDALLDARRGVWPARVGAKNLFEVAEVEFHSVVMPSDTRLPDRMLDRSSHVHVLFELSHGWSDRFETGVFLETSRSSDDAHAAFTGFHFRPKYRFSERQRFPFHLSVSAEFAFVKPLSGTFARSSCR